MVEVGTDGSVYGVDSNGCAYKRRGICPKIPMGTSWVQLRPCKGFKHLSYDSGFLWLITQAGNVLKCAVPVSVVPTLL
ncbi:hypothetical protein GDO86_012257 [Hymenochirus boettgeri]|uniref:Uncharacterized protein n=1 Tax=Hymenochirus boettgeri TaxID=247094 RepID=A0A8T2ILJ4_9PIPI|nr:hypothetical protein GDO86_012257 [Hymenochirus boettgeri]